MSDDMLPVKGRFFGKPYDHLEIIKTIREMVAGAGSHSFKARQRAALYPSIQQTDRRIFVLRDTRILLLHWHEGKARRQDRKARKSQRLLQRLAATPDQLFNGMFRQQFGALCFRRQPANDAIPRRR